MPISRTLEDKEYGDTPWVILQIPKFGFLLAAVSLIITRSRALEDSILGFRIIAGGCSSEASELCMDKGATAKTLEGLRSAGISSASKTPVSMRRIAGLESRDYRTLWDRLTEQLDSETLIAKPIGNGCSLGIARLLERTGVQAYCQSALRGATLIPERKLHGQNGIIEMPTRRMRAVLFEEFIETDRVEIIRDWFRWETRTGWIEITVGVLQTGRKLRAFSPSITVAEGSVLSLEEKFQGGTGVNITPPPASHVSPSAIRNAKSRIEKVASTLGIRGYVRIDACMHVMTGELIIIEANTIPGLTPSTVLFQQALAEKPPLYPVNLLERIIDDSLKRDGERLR